MYLFECTFPKTFRDIFSAFMNAGTIPTYEFDLYLNGPTIPLPLSTNLYRWWANSGSPQLASMAFDILSIPAISTETERVLSGAKLTISPTRNRLGEDVIEATECLNRWYRAGY
jgi:hAT family C-terminal dimerisation region